MMSRLGCCVSVVEDCSALCASSSHVFVSLKKVATSDFPTKKPMLFYSSILSERIENQETTPPKDEYVDLRCIWGVEFYTQSHLDKLIQAFSNLGWDREDSLGRNPVDWVRNLHQHGSVYVPFGVVRGTGDNSHGQALHLTAPMPNGVKRLSPVFCSVTPSLHCMVIRFSLDEVMRARLDGALRQYRHTVARGSDGGPPYSEPYIDKKSDVDQIRQDLKQLLGDWFQQNLRGVFSSEGLLGQVIPTCELITLRQAEPFMNPNQDEADPTLFTKVLDLWPTFFWRCTHISGLKMVTGGSPPFHSIMAAREQDIDHELLKMYGGIEGLEALVDGSYGKLLAELAMWPLLESYRRRLAKYQESYTLCGGRKSPGNPGRILQELLREVPFETSFAAVAADLIDYPR